jgi:hypothetical protein
VGIPTNDSIFNDSIATKAKTVLNKGAVDDHHAAMWAKV